MTKIRLLRKVYKDEDGYHSQPYSPYVNLPRFHYPDVGRIVTAPDWNPKPVCGGGIHGLVEANGWWELLQGTHWMLLEADAVDVVEIDWMKSKCRTAKVLEITEDKPDFERWFSAPVRSDQALGRAKLWPKDHNMENNK